MILKVTSELESELPLLHFWDSTTLRRHRFHRDFSCKKTALLWKPLFMLQSYLSPCCAMSSCKNPVWVDQCATTKLCGVDIRACSWGQGDLPRSVSGIGGRSSHNLCEVSTSPQIIPPAWARAGCAGPTLRGTTTASGGWNTTMRQRNLKDS